MIAAATGFFDGVHLGHRKVLTRLCEIAKARGEKSVVVTFWPHPRSVLQQQAYNLRLLTTLEEKRDLFKEIGINRTIILKFTKEFSLLTTEEFLSVYLKKKYDVDTLVIGYDHKIGHDVNETQAEMIEIARKVGIEVVRVNEYVDGESSDNKGVSSSGEIISSTKIRHILEGGNIAKANSFLGYRYGLKGVIVSGKHIGRTIGFPTANLKLYNPLKLVPENGVYSVYVEVNGKTYMGVCNIGVRPTVGDNNEKTIETHILDFDEDIYGLDLKIEFVDRMRQESKFDSLEKLKEQLCLDKQQARSFLSAALPHIVLR
ncbi:MAG: bifunctional riboflavin kinase/FAD synthetase [Bacteroidales bacterium]